MTLTQYINEFRTVANAYDHKVLTRKQLKRMLRVLLKEFIGGKK